MRIYKLGLLTLGLAGLSLENRAWAGETCVQWIAGPLDSQSVFAMTTLGSRIVAAGAFAQAVPNDSPAHNIIAWNGLGFSRLAVPVGGGEGTNGTVYALKSYQTTGPFGGRFLVVGGTFTTAGGIAANRIAIWSEPTINLPMWSTLGSGFNGAVYAIERHNNQIYAAGAFTLSGSTAVNRIAMWNGSAWVPLGSGMNATVLALRSYGGVLYAGGFFTTAGGINTGGLAYWNGSTWVSTGSSFVGEVHCLEVHDNALVIGGLFGGLQGAPNLARYWGPSGGYQSIVGVGTNATVSALRADGDYLYIGGDFTSIGPGGTGIAANHVARYNLFGGWTALGPGGGGTNGGVYALEVYHNELHAGGFFSATAVPVISSPGWARYLTTGVPWIAQQPLSQTIQCGQNANFSIQVAAGYTSSRHWRRNMVDLIDGPTPHGSTIAGSQTNTLTILNATSADAGSYDCVAFNSCGSGESTAVNLTIQNCCDPDINHDGGVNVSDLLAVVNGWGPCPTPPSRCLADVAPTGGDGVVNVSDLLAIITGWGTCP